MKLTIRHRLTNVFRLGALVFISGLCGSLLTGVGLAQINQPNMVAARQSLHTAINYLNKAEEDKGGHRSNAINLIGQAIVEINRGIGYANHH